MLAATGFIVSKLESAGGCPWMNDSDSIVQSKRTKFKPDPRTQIRIDPNQSELATWKANSKIIRNQIDDFH